MGHWEVGMRRIPTSADARSDMKLLGIEDAVREALLDAVRGQVLPEEWSELVNAQTYTLADVRRDAAEFWEWLYDGAPIPSESPPGH